MDNYEFFERYDIWLMMNFLNTAVVETLRKMAHQNQTEKAKVARVEWMKGGVVDERKRKSDSVIMRQYIKKNIRKRMFEVLPLLSYKFDVRLSAYEGPQLLVYHSKDFFKVHRDRPIRKDHLPDQRQVSTTIFLSSGGNIAEEDDFYGGELAIFYGDPKSSSQRSVEIRGLRGALVAFRSRVPHEVRPVKRGERITVVGWFK